MAHSTFDKMSEVESIKAFCDGLKKASSCAKELAGELQNRDWENTAMMLDAMRENGYTLSRMKTMNKAELSQALSMKSNPHNGVINRQAFRGVNIANG